MFSHGLGQRMPTLASADLPSILAAEPRYFVYLVIAERTNSLWVGGSVGDESVTRPQGNCGARWLADSRCVVKFGGCFHYH